MSIRPNRFVAPCVALALALLALGACAQKEVPVRSTVELMDDPMALQSVLSRCNQTDAVTDRECVNAREAVARLEADEERKSSAQKEAAAQADFERARDARRRRDELQRQRQEAQQSVDPYTMPLVKEPDLPPMQGNAVEPTASASSIGR